ncbi:MAG: tRNA (guanosine(46)-N7)-methyltransferase TrmB [Candidatus Nanopelagicales bacterium]
MQELRVRTFHGRSGRIGPAGRDALERLWPRFGVDLGDHPLDLATTFPTCSRVVLELGSGMGEATAQMAAAAPDTGFLAVEVHTAGVAALLRRIDVMGLDNVRVADGDGVWVLERMITPDSLAGVHVFFPDPWPKARHHKRRFVRPDLIHLTATRLQVGGVLHTATDWPEYADQMLSVLSAEPLLVNRHSGFAPRPPHRPITRFERRGLRLGHPIADLVFERR